ncbi:8240_t:CDS:1, partial [Funneliformis geosporum]
ISQIEDNLSAHDSNSDDSDANESDSDANKSDSDIYFKSDNSDSDNEYDHELHERLTHEEMARIAKLEEKYQLSLPMTILIKYS